MIALAKQIGLTAVLVGAGCAMHRPTEHKALCSPMSDPLTVENGAVTIACAAEHANEFDFRCVIVEQGHERSEKSGLFMFSDARNASGFDPGDATEYGSWDGCVIRLRDGRTLEEVEAISSVCDGVRVKEPAR